MSIEGAKTVAAVVKIRADFYDRRLHRALDSRENIGAGLMNEFMSKARITKWAAMLCDDVVKALEAGKTPEEIIEMYTQGDKP